MDGLDQDEAANLPVRLRSECASLSPRHQRDEHILCDSQTVLAASPQGSQGFSRDVIPGLINLLRASLISKYNSTLNLLHIRNQILESHHASKLGTIVNTNVTCQDLLPSQKFESSKGKTETRQWTQ